MTVINGIEIDDIHYKTNDIKYAIANNDPIEKNLNVIIVLSNPCLYATRYILLREFVKRIEEEEDHVNLFVVELIFPGQRYLVTEAKNKRHLRLKADTPIWHKENMVNLAVKYLLPKDYKAFAWIDADIEFENNTWAMDTLKVLNGSKDIVQLFSHAVDMKKNLRTLRLFNGFGYCFSKQKVYTSTGHDYWHPGYAWAITRKAYEKLGGLYDKGVLGSGDNIIALSLLNKAHLMNHEDYTESYNESMLEYQNKAKSLRLGYVPGVIRHYFHGAKKNRQYRERWQILIEHKFSPAEHLTYDASGILIPTEQFTEEFKEEIMNYFRERKEDEDEEPEIKIVKEKLGEKLGENIEEIVVENV
jgi:hypothetical protein